MNFSPHFKLTCESLIFRVEEPDAGGASAGLSLTYTFVSTNSISNTFQASIVLENVAACPGLLRKSGINTADQVDCNCFGMQMVEKR